MTDKREDFKEKYGHYPDENPPGMDEEFRKSKERVIGRVPRDREIKTKADLIALTNIKRKTRRGRPPRVNGKIDNKTWGLKVRTQAVATYLASGSLTTAKEVTGVGYNTLRQWKKQPWWEEIANDIRKDKSQEIDNALSKIIDKSISVVMDRLESGDYHWDAKSQSIVQVPVKMKDAAIVKAISFDKQRLLRGEATQIVDKDDSANKLASLAEQFKAFATGKKVEDPIEDVEYEEVEEDEGD